MPFYLDDILNEKKGPPPALDLSKARMPTKEEFDKVFEKVPDYKIKPGKVGGYFFSTKLRQFLFSQWRCPFHTGDKRAGYAGC